MATVLLIVSAAVVAAGCASSQGGSDNSLGAHALQSLSPFEKRVLKDKYVTEAEFDESMRVYTECLTAAGLRYDITPGEVGMGSVWVHGSGSPGVHAPNAADDGMQRCVDQVDAVQEVWIQQNHVRPSDIAAVQEGFVSCLRDAGLPIKADATIADAESAMSRFMGSVPQQHDDGSPQAVTAAKLSGCRQDYQKVSVVQPLPGLQEALSRLDTSGW